MCWGHPRWRVAYLDGKTRPQSFSSPLTCLSPNAVFTVSESEASRIIVGVDDHWVLCNRACSTGKVIHILSSCPLAFITHVHPANSIQRLCFLPMTENNVIFLSLLVLSSAVTKHNPCAYSIFFFCSCPITSLMELACWSRPFFFSCWLMILTEIQFHVTEKDRRVLEAAWAQHLAPPLTFVISASHLALTVTLTLPPP